MLNIRNCTRNKFRHWQIFCLSWNIKQTEAKVSNAEQQMSSVVNCTAWPTGWLPYCAWTKTGDSRTKGQQATVGQTNRRVEEKGPAEDEDRGPSPEIDWLAGFVNEENVEFAVENRSQLLLLLQLATHTVRGQFHWGQTDTDGDAVGLADENGRPVTFSAILLRQPRRSTTQKLRHKLKTKFSNFCSLPV